MPPATGVAVLPVTVQFTTVSGSVEATSSPPGLVVDELPVIVESMTVVAPGVLLSCYLVHMPPPLLPVTVQIDHGEGRRRFRCTGEAAAANGAIAGVTAGGVLLVNGRRSRDKGGRRRRHKPRRRPVPCCR